MGCCVVIAQYVKNTFLFLILYFLLKRLCFLSASRFSTGAGIISVAYVISGAHLVCFAFMSS